MAGGGGEGGEGGEGGGGGGGGGKVVCVSTAMDLLTNNTRDNPLRARTSHSRLSSRKRTFATWKSASEVEEMLGHVAGLRAKMTSMIESVVSEKIDHLSMKLFHERHLKEAKEQIS
eukprot:588319-Hanusia_phi.AAC.1